MICWMVVVGIVVVVGFFFLIDTGGNIDGD